MFKPALSLYLGRLTLLFIFALFLSACQTSRHSGLDDTVKRVVFLGDSTTYQGGAVANFDAWVKLTYPQRTIDVLNLGLSSETVSGLSEDGHAEGRFPRPYVHERLNRVLSMTKPDLLIVMYGINCGIYQDFSEHNFAAFTKGMTTLHNTAIKKNIDIIHITPPIFDKQTGAIPAKNYNKDVLSAYTQWLKAKQRENDWKVIDFWTDMNTALAAQRQRDSQFQYQHDGVHLNEDAYWLLSQLLFNYFGDHASNQFQSLDDMLGNTANPRLVKTLLHNKMEILRDAWLSKTKHLRPELPTGLPLDQANQQAADLDRQIHTLLNTRIRR